MAEGVPAVSTGDALRAGPTAPLPPPIQTYPAAVTPAPQQPGQYADGIDKDIVNSGRNNSPETQQQLNVRSTDAAIHGDPKTAPSFFQTVLEIVEFVARCFFPIVSMISAIIRIGRLIYEAFSGTQKEHIDWTQELARTAGDMLAFIPGFGGVLSAVANTGLNWWYGTESKDRVSPQIMGGANYFFGPDWLGKRDSVGYYTEKLFNGAGNMFSGAGGLFSATPATAAPAALPPPVVMADQPQPYAAAPGVPQAVPGPGQPALTVDPNAPAQPPPGQQTWITQP